MIIEFCQDVGITDPGDPRTRAKCMEIARSYFPRFTLDNISAAFDMVIIGQIVPQEDHYGRLIPKYIASVYRLYQASMSRQKNSGQAQQRPAGKDPDYNEKMFKTIEQEKVIFHETGQLSIRNYLSMYDFMDDQSLFTLTDDQVKEVITRVRVAYSKEKKIDESSVVGRFMAQARGQLQINQEEFKFYVKKQYVIRQFELWDAEEKKE